MKLSEAIKAIEDASSEEYLKRIDAAECTDWLDAAFALYAGYSALEAKLTAIPCGSCDKNLLECKCDDLEDE